MNQVDEALGRLSTAAAEVGRSWLPESWRRVAGPAPDEVTMVRVESFVTQEPVGSFDGLDFEPGAAVTLEARIDVPARFAGVPLVGEPLELTLHSVYPMDISVDGRSVFSDGVPPVAAGPALIEVLPRLAEGDNGALTVRISPPDHELAQSFAWLHMRFTTPGLRARFDQLDLAHAQLTLAATLAATPADAKVVESAAAAVPADLLALDASTLCEALAAVSAALTPMAEQMSALRLHLIGHSHIDLAWLWTWEDTVEVIKRDARSVLAMLDDYPDMTFTHSQPASYALLRDEEPELFARILDHIASGRWEPATMQWVEGDTNLASGEATVRQLLEAVRFSRDELVAGPRVLLAPDTFGHAGTLPQLAASAGARVYYHHRCNPGHRRDGTMWPAYWWEGQDGTRLLAVSTHSYNGDITASGVVKALLVARNAGHPVGLMFYGVGDHGGGPTRQALDRLSRLQEQSAFPSLLCSSVASYGQELLESGVALPTHRGESATTFEGCYTSHRDAKQRNRHAENVLGTAETLATVAALDRTAELAGAWRQVLFNQFHDILDGAAIPPVYQRNEVELRATTDTAQSVLEQALEVLHAGLEVGTIAVTNPHGWERQDVVLVDALTGTGTATLLDPDGVELAGQYTEQGLCFVARVPALQTTQYRVVDDGRDWCAMALSSPQRAMEPDRYVQIDTSVFTITVRLDSGIITSLVDRRSGTELVAFGMRRSSDYTDAARPDLALHVLQLVEEAPHIMSAWHLDEVRTEQSLLEGADYRLVENGPVRTVLEFTHSVRASSITTRVIAYQDLDRIDFWTDVDWHEEGGPEVGVPNLKVSFTASLPETQAWYETPYGAVRRNSDGQEVPALRWASIGGDSYGFSVLNESIYGHDALGGRLRLNLVRSSYSPDRVSDAGHRGAGFSLVPHIGDWRAARIPQRAAGFNQPLIARAVASSAAAGGPAWRPAVSADTSVLVGALKFAHRDGGRVIRLYESAGRPARATVSDLGRNARAWSGNIVEDRAEELPVTGGKVELAFRPWQVQTLLIDSDG